MAVFDHIAIAATSLAEGAEALEAALGVPLEAGGKHAQMGTHNRLLSLGEGEYLELITIDPDAPGPDRPRWFALDDFEGATRPQSWIVRADDLGEALSVAPGGSGEPVAFRRDNLTWTFALPDSGLQPFDGTSPAVIEWGPGVPHPSSRLPDRGVRLTGLCLRHPRAPDLERALERLIADPRLRFETGAPGLVAEFQTPSGRVVLG
ncbi:VOC family protein [Cereibacter sphaeroides]|nr:VOC family protein [Cereibacter sphaeroides]